MNFHYLFMLFCYDYLMRWTINAEYSVSNTSSLIESNIFGNRNTAIKIPGNYSPLISSALNHQMEDERRYMEMLIPLINTYSTEKTHNVLKNFSVEQDQISFESYMKTTNGYSSDLESSVYNDTTIIDIIKRSSASSHDLLQTLASNFNVASLNHVGFDYDFASSFGDDDDDHYQITDSYVYHRNQVETNFYSLNISNDYVRLSHYPITNSSDKLLHSDAYTVSFLVATHLPNVSNENWFIYASQTSQTIQSLESSESSTSFILQSTFALRPTKILLPANSTDLRFEIPEETSLSSAFVKNKDLRNFNTTAFLSDACSFNFAKPVTYEFILVFNFTSFKRKEYLLQLLRNFFNDTNCFIQMTAFIAGTPAVFSWTNSSHDYHECSNSNVERSWLSMVEENGHLKKDFVNWFRPNFEISEVQKRYLSLCIEIKPSFLPNGVVVVITVIFLLLCFVLLLGVYKKKNCFKHKTVCTNNIFNEASALKHRMPTILLMERV